MAAQAFVAHTKVLIFPAPMDVLISYLRKLGLCHRYRRAREMSPVLGSHRTAASVGVLGDASV